MQPDHNLASYIYNKFCGLKIILKVAQNYAMNLLVVKHIL